MIIFKCFRCSKRWLIEQPLRSRAKNKCPACDGVLNLEREFQVVKKRRPVPSPFFRYFVKPIGAGSNKFVWDFLDRTQSAEQALTVAADERGRPINLYEVPSSTLGDFLASQNEGFDFRIFRCRKSGSLKVDMKNIC